MADATAGKRAIVRIGIVIEVVVQLRLVIPQVEVRDIAVPRNRTCLALALVRFFRDRPMIRESLL